MREKGDITMRIIGVPSLDTGDNILRADSLIKLILCYLIELHSRLLLFLGQCEGGVYRVHNLIIVTCPLLVFLGYIAKRP